MPSATPSVPLHPLIAHALPRAPSFAGRDAELAALRAFWQRPRGVLALLGPGGAGKTCIADRFLEQVLVEDPPDGLLVWSFYDEPDANAFLQTAYRYFAGGKPGEARGAGWFHLLKDALSTNARFVLVLDGLERVQRPGTSTQGIYGETDDPLLRGLLTRLAVGVGRTKAILTSRFPVADIERWRGQGYEEVVVDELSRRDAHGLLRTHGCRGDDATLDRVLTRHGRHALTVDLLGGAIALFFGGDAAAAPGPPEPGEGAATGDEQYRKLAAVLQVYEERLPERALALLSRLCIFRFGVDAAALASIFLGEDRQSIAGALHGITRDELATDLTHLSACHLILRDGHGRFTVHPAVRDYFYHLFAQRSAVHEAVGEHLRTLTRQPGVGLPTDKATLDMLEELIYHILQAGSVQDAVEIYYHRLGGDQHLNAKLGEYARTYRILASFRRCPDGSAMYHCLRAFGRFQEALEWRPQNRYILLANGALADLAQSPDQTTQRVAAFLRGEGAAIPPRSPDLPIPSAMLHLLRGDAAEARRVAEGERAASLFADDVARQDLALAEAARHAGDRPGCAQKLEAAASWILQSGSQEHLCLMHLVRARLAVDSRDDVAARSALDEGLHIAGECGFTLWQVDLLNTRARHCLQRADTEAAAAAAREARTVASADGCGYAWGAGQAGRLLGEALAAQGCRGDARAVLREALALMKAIADPAAGEVERALAALGPDAGA